MLSRHVCGTAIVVAVLIHAAPTLLAQRANGPYAGLLGQTPDAQRAQGLDLTGTLFGAYDLNTFPGVDTAATTDPRLKQSGTSEGLTAALDYNRSGDHGRFTWSGGAVGRNYSTNPGIVSAYSSAATLALILRPRLVMDARASVGYSPFLQFSPFSEGAAIGGGNPAPAFDFAALEERNIAADGAIGISSNFTSRSSFSAGIDGRKTRLLDLDRNDLSSWAAHAGVRHKLTRRLGVHLEYGQQHVTYGEGGAPLLNSSIDAGLDYSDTLSFSRQSSLTFGTSTSAVHYLSETHYRLNGAARLSRGFGRSWSAAVGYARDTQFRIGFRQPLLTDSGDAGLAGQLSLRAKVSAGVVYTRGAVGFEGSTFSTYSASSRLDFALRRSLGLYGQYGYYRYTLPPGASDIPFLLSLARQSVSAGLSVWVPIINEGRRSGRPK